MEASLEWFWKNKQTKADWKWLVLRVETSQAKAAQCNVSLEQQVQERQWRTSSAAQTETQRLFFFFFLTWAGRRSCKRQQEAGDLLHITSPQPNTPPIGKRTTNTLRRERDFFSFCGSAVWNQTLRAAAAKDSHTGIWSESSSSTLSFPGMWPFVPLWNQAESLCSWKSPNRIQSLKNSSSSA